MKQRTSHILFGYWNEIRGNRMAPRRFEIEPSRISNILAETFILERSGNAFIYRLAGSQICDTFGAEQRGRSFAEIAGQEARDTFEHVMATITNQGAVGVLEVEAENAAGQTVRFEAIVLPLTHLEHEVSRYVGAVSAINPPQWVGTEALRDFKLVDHAILWPDGRPHAVIERSNHQAPFMPEFENARIVRLNRRQFRVLDGGLANQDPRQSND